jgi:RND family efflux transporter MFP subunit
MEQARRDLERATSLLSQNALSPQDFDAAQARERVAAATVTGAETMLGYGVINAPFDGVITRKLAEQGDTASPGKPLVEIEDPTRLRLETDVPEALALQLTTGQKIAVHIPSLREDRSGVVAEIAPVADPVSRTVRVKLDVDTSGDLRPGLFGRARIPAGKVETLQVPASALIQRGQMEIVLVAKDGRASLRLVRAGRTRDGKVDILSGLAAGELVVTEGAETLRDGRKLEVRP